MCAWACAGVHFAGIVCIENACSLLCMRMFVCYMYEYVSIYSSTLPRSHTNNFQKHLLGRISVVQAHSSFV